ncbi:MAG: hypothetical protein RLY71_4614 [Pseudomonadota bacterium]|jgi:hypothetical protein
MPLPTVPRALLLGALLLALLPSSQAGGVAADTAASNATAATASTTATTYPATPDYLAAFQTFQRAAQGDSAAIEPAAEQFGALSRARPGDPLSLAYAGSATTLRATTTMLPWRKMSYAEDGLAQLDKALALLGPAHDAQRVRGSAVSLETRFTAARTFLALPEMFHRSARGQRLLDEVLASPLLPAAALPLRGEVWLRAGQLAAQQQRPADARRWFGLVIAQQAPQAGQAAARLKELAP